MNETESLPWPMNTFLDVYAKINFQGVNRSLSKAKFILAS